MWIHAQHVGGSLLSHVHSSRATWLDRAHEHGAVILRSADAPDASADSFSRLCAAMDLTPFDASESAAPRTRVATHAWTANEAPANAIVPFHHEMAQCRTMPRYVLFFCQTAPFAWGCTPLVRSDVVARVVRERFPDVSAELDARGIRYRRTLPRLKDPESPIGRGWTDALGTTDRAAAERALRRRGLEGTWLPGNDLRTETRRRRVFARAPDGPREEVFLNSAVAALEGWQDARNRPGDAVVYGDTGEPLSDAALELFAFAGAYMNETATRIRWRAGDVMLLDNTRVLHARDPFVPPRRVLASLWGPRR